MTAIYSTLPYGYDREASADSAPQPASPWCAPCPPFDNNVFSGQVVLQVLEFDLRSCGGARAFLVTSSAAVLDDGEVRRRAHAECRVGFPFRVRTRYPFKAVSFALFRSGPHLSGTLKVVRTLRRAGSLIIAYTSSHSLREIIVATSSVAVCRTTASFCSRLWPSLLRSFIFGLRVLNCSNTRTK